MTRRADFLAAARAHRASAPGLNVQARARGDDGPPRFGFTCSRKVGNAVARNRARRRLREAARHALAPMARPGWDYVLIGRRDATAARPWGALLEDVRRAAARIHG